MKDYYRKPYMFDDYSDMLTTQTNESTRECLADIRKFEFLKPYSPDVEDKVEQDYERIVNEYTIPTTKLLDLYLLKGEDNFTLDYKRYHPPNKAHMCPEIPDPWGQALYGVAHGVTYDRPHIPIESPNPRVTTMDTRKGVLQWKYKLEGAIDADKIYYPAVVNSYVQKETTKNGKITQNITTYKSAFFSIKKVTSDGKGVKLFQYFNLYGWIDVKSNEFVNIRKMVLNKQILQNKDTSTVTKLVVSSGASGKYNIKVTDGITTLTAPVTIKSLKGLFLKVDGGKGYIKLNADFSLSTTFNYKAYICGSKALQSIVEYSNVSTYTFYEVTGPRTEVTGPWGMCGDTGGGSPYYFWWHTHGYWDVYKQVLTAEEWEIRLPDGTVLDSDSDNFDTGMVYLTYWEDVVMVCSTVSTEGSVSYPGPTYENEEDEDNASTSNITSLFFTNTLYAYYHDSTYYGDATLISILQDIAAGKSALIQETIDDSLIWLYCNDHVWVVQGSNITEVFFPDTVEIGGITYTVYWKNGLYENY